MAAAVEVPLVVSSEEESEVHSSLMQLIRSGRESGVQGWVVWVRHLFCGRVSFCMVGVKG